MAGRCRDCGVRWAQELGKCRRCQAQRLIVDTPETRRCVQCDLTSPYARCELNQGHVGPHGRRVEA